MADKIQEPIQEPAQAPVPIIIPTPTPLPIQGDDSDYVMRPEREEESKL